jgi:3-oxoadipate enol-lactonase
MNHMHQKSPGAALRDSPTWAEAPVQMTDSDPRIAYRAGGREQGVPVVLLHSLAADQSTWGPVAEVLEQNHYVITLDSRGHGKSETAHASGPESWALDIIEVLDALSIKRALLVGVSMGGIQAIAAAAAAPERVAGIIVADSFAALPEEVSVARIDGLSSFASQHAMNDVADKYVSDTFVAPGDVRGPELVRQTMGTMDRESYLSAVRACFGADVRPALERVKAPALVLWGELDEKTPRTLSMDIAAAIPDAAFESIPDAAHLSHLDQPAIFASLVSRFAHSLTNG